MKNKKAYMRILEVAIAAMLILGFIYFVSIPTYIKKTEIDKEIYKVENEILDSIAKSHQLRTAVLQENEVVLATFVKEKLLERNLNGTVRVCEIESACIISGLPEKNIYVRDRIIATNLSAYQPKKVVLYVWTLY